MNNTILRPIEMGLTKGSIAHMKEEDGTYSIIYISSKGFSDQEYLAKNLLRQQAIKLSVDLLDYLRYDLPDVGVNFVHLLKTKLEEMVSR
jgi:hypothetical protein